MDPPCARFHSSKDVPRFGRSRCNRADRATKGRRMNFWLSRAAETRTAYRFLYVVSERQRALLSRIVRVRTGIGALDPLSHSQRSFALQVLVNRSPSSIGECVSPSTCPDLLLLLFLRIRRKRVLGSTIYMSQGLEAPRTGRNELKAGILGPKLQNSLASLVKFEVEE